MQNCRMGGTLLVVIALLASCRAAEPSGPVVLERIGTIEGPSADRGFQGVTLLSARFSDGERIAVTPWERPLPPIYRVREDGVVADTLASIGEGPGQVQQPRWVIRGLGDTIIVADVGRLHFFSPEHRYVRTIPCSCGGVWSATQLSNGLVVLGSSSVGGRKEVVSAFSPVDGSVRWSIRGAEYDREMVPENRLLAPAPDGTLWVVRAWGKYELQQYSQEGALLRTLTLAADWFPPYERQHDPSGRAAPNTALTGFQIDSTGRAWVVAQAADPDWASAEGSMQRGEGGLEFFVPKRGDDVRDGIIDVIDLAQGRSLATWRRDSIFGPFAEAGVMYSWRSSEDGWTNIDLYRVVPHF